MNTGRVTSRNWQRADFQALPPGRSTSSRTALKAATREFEAIFTYQMIAAMRRTVGQGGLLDKSQGEQIFEGMLDQEWARELAGRNGPSSLSEILYRQLNRYLEPEPPIPAPAEEPGSLPGLDRQ